MNPLEMGAMTISGGALEESGVFGAKGRRGARVSAAVEHCVVAVLAEGRRESERERERESEGERERARERDREIER